MANKTRAQRPQVQLETVIDPALAEIIADAESEVEYEDMLQERREFIEEHSGELQRLLNENGGGSESALGGMQLTSTGGMVDIYNRASGEKAMVTYDQLKARLKVRFDSTHHMVGQRVWQRAKMTPKIVGVLKCPLHVEHDERAHWDAYGLPICRKHNLVSQYQVDRHVKLKHPSLFEIRKNEKEERDHAEQMKFFEVQSRTLEGLLELQKQSKDS